MLAPYAFQERTVNCTMTSRRRR